MGLEVPVGRVESLPDTVQVRFAVSRARCLVDLGLARGRHCAHQESGHPGGRGTRRCCASPPISHVRLLSKLPVCPAGAAATLGLVAKSRCEPPSTSRWCWLPATLEHFVCF